MQPERSLSEYNQMVRALCQKLGVYRLSPDRHTEFAQVFGREAAAYTASANSHEPSYVDGLLQIANRCGTDLNAVALLCALFREAHLTMDLDRARNLRNLIRHVEDPDMFAPEGQRAAEDALWKLIHMRIIKNQEVSTADYDNLFKRLSPNVRVKHILREFGSLPEPVGRRNQCEYPITARDMRVDWFEGNQQEATKMAEQIQALFEQLPPIRDRTKPTKEMALNQRTILDKVEQIRDSLDSPVGGGKKNVGSRESGGVGYKRLDGQSGVWYRRTR